ncbi:hypothetical protein [Sphingobacterium rhinopitheci]|nr:hypothetical protein [Sphingobacterium rhinopitheci]
MKISRNTITNIAVVAFVLLAAFLIYNFGYSLGQFIVKMNK